jgi:hypothetical protein
MGALLTVTVLVLPVFALASFTGGFASALAAGGREDHSLLTNAAIGFVGWLAASTIWSLGTGKWPSELHSGLLLLTFACSVLAAWLWDRHRSRTASLDPVSH